MCIRDRVGSITGTLFFMEVIVLDEGFYPCLLYTSEELLKNNGLYAFRKDGEKHAWNPETISTLQLATRLGSYKKFKEDVYKRQASIISAFCFIVPVDSRIFFFGIR